MFVFLTISTSFGAENIRNEARSSWIKGEKAHYFNGGTKVVLQKVENCLAVQYKNEAPAEVGLNTIRELGSYSLDRTLAGNNRKGPFIIQLTPGAGSLKSGELMGIAGSPEAFEYISPVYTLSGGNSPLIPTDTIMIRLEDSTSDDDLNKLLTDNDLRVVNKFKSAPHFYLAALDQGNGELALETANRLAQQPGVVFAHPNFVVEVKRRYTPDDTLYSFQWHLNNTGQSGGTVDADVDAPEAWDVTKGSSGVRICIIDDGVEHTHQDLNGNYVNGRDVIDEDDDPTPNSFDSHGTSCAGMAAAVGENTMGVAGIAYQCGLQGVRLVASSQQIADEVEAFEWAVDNGASVLSNSWGPADAEWIYYPLPASVEAAFEYAFTTGRSGLGCVISWAGGNGDERSDLDGYASYPGVLNVGASTHNNQKAPYSDFGPSINVMAPSSDDVVGTTSTSLMNKGDLASHYTSYFGGTSSSAPLAAGIAGLVISVNPNLNYRVIRAVLQRTADQFDSLNGQYNTAGRSFTYGYGRVNAAAAVALANDTSDATAPNAVADLSADSSSCILKLGWTAPGDDGTSGRALMYDLRYSMSPIDDANFNDAEIYWGLELPLAQGETEVIKVSGLTESQSYYFALKTYDNNNNASAISNVITAVIPPAPMLTEFYSEDFESGAGGWVGDGTWARSTISAHSGSWAWTDSPAGNYGDDANMSVVSPAFDFSGYQKVTLKYYQKYSLEFSYDTGRVEVSTNNGLGWTAAYSGVTGVQGGFIENTVDLSDFDNMSDILIRFRLFADGVISDDGWYIDDVSISGCNSGLSVDDWTTAYRATPLSGAILLEWDPAYDSSTPIDYHIYTASVSGGQNFNAPAATTQDTSFVLTGLTNGIRQHIVIRAENSVFLMTGNTNEVSCVPGANLMSSAIYNNNFENGIALLSTRSPISGKPAGWEASDQEFGSKTTSYIVDDTDPYEGTACALVETSGTPVDPDDLSIASLTADNAVSLLKGHTYTVSAAVRRNQGQWLRFILFSSGFSLIHTESFDALDTGTADTGWQKYYFSFTPPENINVYVRLDNLVTNDRTAGGAFCRMWVDDVQIIDNGIETLSDIYNPAGPPQLGIRNRYFDLGTELETTTIGGSIYSATGMPKRWNIAMAIDNGSNDAAGYPVWGQKAVPAQFSQTGQAAFITAKADDTLGPAYPAMTPDGVNMDLSLNNGQRHVLTFDYGVEGVGRTLLRVFMIQGDFSHYSSLFVDPVIQIPASRLWPLALHYTPAFNESLFLVRFDNVTLTQAGVHLNEATVYLKDCIVSEVVD